VAYKALGWTVWKAAKLYLRHRYGGIVTRRRALVAAGALAAVAAVAVAGRGAARD
jgi:hypothetical protein